MTINTSATDASATGTSATDASATDASATGASATDASATGTSATDASATDASSSDGSTRAEIAVIGGSGLYELFDPSESTTLEIDTPYGHAQVTIGQRAGRQVAFLPRHGTGHSEAPHLINYRANIWALASLGVKASSPPLPSAA
ncbi:hypothetical protein [Cryobacterium sp. MLB-32]|uniref:hypothetical protein n=1 Tax=Cryobacterium sp. MLB-32 TaxID=1529318 RepID=UPI001E3C6223|nr:hypothetical protein [Cryobacterium sp. MLB-32]